MWRVRVTLAAPPGTDVEALHAEGDRLMVALVRESLAVAAVEDVAVPTDGGEGTATPDATVVADSAEQAEALLVGLVRGMTPWPVVRVTSEAI